MQLLERRARMHSEVEKLRSAHLAKEADHDALVHQLKRHNAELEAAVTQMRAPVDEEPGVGVGADGLGSAAMAPSVSHGDRYVVLQQHAARRDAEQQMKGAVARIRAEATEHVAALRKRSDREFHAVSVRVGGALLAFRRSATGQTLAHPLARGHS